MVTISGLQRVASICHARQEARRARRMSSEASPRRAARAVGLPSPLTAAPTLQAIDEHFARVAERDHVPGIAYALVAGGDVVHAGGVGVLRVGQREAPGPDTVSRICSMTKSFVAAALLLLRDQGRLGLDDPVARHVPELASLSLPTADSPQLTIRSLLTMSSGLPDDDYWADRQMDLPARGVDALLRAGATFGHPPGTVFEYSNFGWVMLGRVVTSVSKMTVQGFVAQHILRPLGLASTSWSLPSRAQGSAMTGHRRRDGAWAEESAPLDDGDFAPMGGLWSSAADVARWMGFLLDAFPPRDDPDDGPLSRASRREMQQVCRAWPSSYDPAYGRLTAGGYGLGLMITHDLRFGYIVGHPGGLPGFGSFMRWLPDRGVGVVALGNLTYAPMDPATLECLELLDHLGALPPKASIVPAPALIAARDRLAWLLNAWDDELADDLFAANVFADEERDRRRNQATVLQERCGPLTPGELEASSATAAAFDLHGQRGDVRVSLSLSPEVPPRVQWYEVVSACDGEGGRSGAGGEDDGGRTEVTADGESDQTGAQT
jgi:CubicO group peptidase (beta-lactamase class C family)